MARIGLALVVAGLTSFALSQTPLAAGLTPSAPPAATPSPIPAAATPASTPTPAATPSPLPAAATPASTPSPSAAPSPLPAATPAAAPTPTVAPTPIPAATATPAAPPLASPPPLPPAPSPPPLPPEPVYYYNNGGTPAGPLSLADLQAKIAAGAIGPATLVWKSGTAAWVAAKDLPDLSSSFASAVPTPTPAPYPTPATGQPGATTPDIRSFFVGAWETDGPGPAGTIGLAKMVLALGQTGSVQGTYSVRLAAGGAMVSLPVSGSWSVAQLPNNLVNLTLNLVVRGENGQPQAVNSTTTVQIVDQNTIRDTAQGTVSKRVSG
jgi:hypothetical protein